jgi:hypothetical protein
MSNKFDIKINGMNDGNQVIRQIRRDREDNVWISVKDKGLLGDDSANDATALNILITAIGSTPTDLYFPRGIYRLGTNVTIPNNINIIMACGAVLKPLSGVTITGTNTKIEAGLYQWIDCSLSATPLAGTWDVIEVYPEWFGAKGDGVTDDTTAINKAANFVRNNGINLNFRGVTYLTTAELNLSYIHACGVEGKTVLKAGSSFVANSKGEKNMVFWYGNYNTLYTAHRLENVVLDCGYYAEYGIMTWSGEAPTIRHVHIIEPLFDGLCLKTMGNYHWIENLYSHRLKIHRAGRHGISLFANDLNTSTIVFINGAIFERTEVRGVSFQQDGGCIIYAECKSQIGNENETKIANISWYYNQFDVLKQSGRLPGDAVTCFTDGDVGVLYRSKYENWRFMSGSIESRINRLTNKYMINVMDGAICNNWVVEGLVRYNIDYVYSNTLLARTDARLDSTTSTNEVIYPMMDKLNVRKMLITDETVNKDTLRFVEKDMLNAYVNLTSSGNHSFNVPIASAISNYYSRYYLAFDVKLFFIKGHGVDYSGVGKEVREYSLYVTKMDWWDQPVYHLITKETYDQDITKIILNDVNITYNVTNKTLDFSLNVGTTIGGEGLLTALCAYITYHGNAYEQYITPTVV